MIIKAGTYRLNDTLTIAYFEQNIPFAVNQHIVNDNGNLSIESGTTIFNKMIISDSVYVDTLCFDSIDYPVFDGTYKWNTLYEFTLLLGCTASEEVKGFGQTITVTADTEVDEAFATWFEANTEPAEEKATIKAGTYTFNNKINLSEFVGLSINFVSYGENFEQIYTQKYYDASEPHQLVYQYVERNEHNQIRSLVVYEPDRWTFLKRYQTITVLEDTEVSKKAYDSFIKATTPPAVEISYKGETVINLEAGQTVRLHNEDGSNFGFTEDLVIKANESNIPEFTHGVTVEKDEAINEIRAIAIEYDGGVMSAIEDSGGTMTIQCAGKVMKDNIVITIY